MLPVATATSYTEHKIKNKARKHTILEVKEVRFILSLLLRKDLLNCLIPINLFKIIKSLRDEINRIKS